jgi:hypothetical protein
MGYRNIGEPGPRIENLHTIIQKRTFLEENGDGRGARQKGHSTMGVPNGPTLRIGMGARVH